MRPDLLKTSRGRRLTSAVAALAVLGSSYLAPRIAEACGCTSPPEPQSVSGDTFAVNQSAEQIIFEVHGDTVTAHVPERSGGGAPLNRMALSFADFGRLMRKS